MLKIIQLAIVIMTVFACARASVVADGSTPSEDTSVVVSPTVEHVSQTTGHGQ